MNSVLTIINERYKHTIETCQQRYYNYVTTSDIESYLLTLDDDQIVCIINEPHVLVYGTYRSLIEAYGKNNKICGFSGNLCIGKVGKIKLLRCNPKYKYDRTLCDFGENKIFTLIDNTSENLYYIQRGQLYDRRDNRLIIVQFSDDKIHDKCGRALLGDKFKAIQKKEREESLSDKEEFPITLLYNIIIFIMIVLLVTLLIVSIFRHDAYLTSGLGIVLFFLILGWIFVLDHDQGINTMIIDHELHNIHKKRANYEIVNNSQSSNYDMA